MLRMIQVTYLLQIQSRKTRSILKLTLKTAKKSYSACSSPSPITSYKTCKNNTEIKRNLTKPRPLSTTIEFPLRKRILRQISLTGCSSISCLCSSVRNTTDSNVTNSSSCSSSSSLYLLKSSFELFSSSNNLSDVKCDGIYIFYYVAMLS